MVGGWRCNCGAEELWVEEEEEREGQDGCEVEPSGGYGSICSSFGWFWSAHSGVVWCHYECSIPDSRGERLCSLKWKRWRELKILSILKRDERRRLQVTWFWIPTLKCTMLLRRGLTPPSTQAHFSLCLRCVTMVDVGGCLVVGGYVLSSYLCIWYDSYYCLERGRRLQLLFWHKTHHLMILVSRDNMYS